MEVVTTVEEGKVRSQALLERRTVAHRLIFVVIIGMGGGGAPHVPRNAGR
jgi:hypothetical protein